MRISRQRVAVAAVAVFWGVVLASAGWAEEGSTHWTNSDPVGTGLGAVDSAALAATPRNKSEWLHYGGNHAGWRHSPITSLTPKSVGQLKVAWAFQTGMSGQLEANPIVYDGVMYVTSAYNRLFALDAATGEVIWRYDHPQPDDLRLCCGPANRGAAIAGDAILMGTLDARLVALHRKTGEMLWNTEIAPYQDGVSVTSAPLALGDDLVAIGIGGGEYGARGFLDAYNTTTGERVWRLYTVPAAGEPGAETWSGNSYETGGAPTWSLGAYETATDTLYWPTGNPAPDWNGDLRKGDNLYSDSILAIDAKKGTLKWYFQATPHDVWDYDGNSELWLVDIEHEGKARKAIVQANRNGFFYILDRTTGEFLSATPYVDKMNWAKGIDEKGRPIVNPDRVPILKDDVLICPGIAGGNNAAYAGSVNPELGLAFVPSIESCIHLEKAESVFVKGVPFFGGAFGSPDRDAGEAYGNIVAIDVATGERRWTHREKLPVMAGTLSTAGGVVITGNSEGHALALDSKTGKELWRFSTGSGIRSQPMAYEIGGKTYVAIGSGGGGLVQEIVGSPSVLPHGSTLFVFELP